MESEKPIRIDLEDNWIEYVRDVATCLEIYIEKKTNCQVDCYVKYRRADVMFSVYVYCPEYKKNEIITLIKSQLSDGFIKDIKEPTTIGRIGHPVKPKESKKTTMSKRYYQKMKEWFLIEMERYETDQKNNISVIRNHFEFKQILENMNIKQDKKII